MKKFCAICLTLLCFFPVFANAQICIQNTNSFLGDIFIASHGGNVTSVMPGLTGYLKYEKGMRITLFRLNMQSSNFVGFLYPDGDNARYKIWSVIGNTSWKQIPNGC